MFYEVIPEGKVEALTYDYTGSLVPGQIVIVPVGKRQVPGVVVKKVTQPSFKTRSIIKVLYAKPLPQHLLAVVKFIHEYYLAASGQALSLVLPRGVQKKRRNSASPLDGSCRLLSSPKIGGNFGGPPPQPSPVHAETEHLFGGSPGWVLAEPVDSVSGLEFSKMSYAGRPGEPPALRANLSASSGIYISENSNHFTMPSQQVQPPTHEAETEQNEVSREIPLNSAQKKALKSLQEAPGATKLLFGVTGSGKTNIYLKMALNALQSQKSTILLVPEIALTGQLVRVFQEVFGGRVVVIHSRQTEAERHLIFETLLENTKPVIVIGPRSALFAPLDNLGLIIVDEEHETTYYQENAPKYSAIRVASFMARGTGCELVLGSATPVVEDYYLASRQKSVIELREKAKDSAVKPKIKIIDFKNRDNFSKNKYFSNSLLQAIQRNLEQSQQTLIFHNRRGSAPLTICESCGEELLCPNCYLPLNLHADEYVLHCHTCGHQMRVPVSCPKCGAPGLVHKGFGTKLLESELKKLFPKARVRRFDADNKKGESLDAVYNEVKNGEIDIIVGTQTVAKGLDLPKLATVGVVQADAGLSLPDYMAEERVFQLLTQVMGRVGRGHLETAEVFVQTFQPDHPVLKFATEEDYKGFYNYLIKKRQKAGFPPFKFIAKLEITLKTEAIVLRKVRELVAKLSRDERLIISPPQPAFHERTAKGYTWQIFVRSRSRKALTEACSDIDQNFRVTMDPPGLL